MVSREGTSGETNLACSSALKGSINRAAATASAAGPGERASPLKEMTSRYREWGIMRRTTTLRNDSLDCSVLSLLDAFIELVVVANDVRGRRQQTLKFGQ